MTPSIIDLEMGLPSLVESILGADGRRRRPGTEDSGPPRVDVVSVEKTTSGPRIVFWEVKLVSDSRLVSRSDPEVVRQVQKYREFFSDPGREKDVQDGYVKTCVVLTALLDMAECIDRQGRRLHPIVSEVVKEPHTLGIEKSARLLIHCPGQGTSSWSSHLDKLRSTYGITCLDVVDACDLEKLPIVQK
jgi:hypothetical protein